MHSTKIKVLVIAKLIPWLALPASRPFNGGFFIDSEHSKDTQLVRHSDKLRTCL